MLPPLPEVDEWYAQYCVPKPLELCPVGVAITYWVVTLLAAVQPSDAGAASVWTTYLRDWTFWNHVRTVACLLSSGLLTVALLLIGRS